MPKTKTHMEMINEASAALDSANIDVVKAKENRVAFYVKYDIWKMRT